MKIPVYVTGTIDTYNRSMIISLKDEFKRGYDDLKIIVIINSY